VQGPSAILSGSPPRPKMAGFFPLSCLKSSSHFPSIFFTLVPSFPPFYPPVLLRLCQFLVIRRPESFPWAPPCPPFYSFQPSGVPFSVFYLSSCILVLLSIFFCQTRLNSSPPFFPLKPSSFPLPPPFPRSGVLLIHKFRFQTPFQKDRPPFWSHGSSLTPLPSPRSPFLIC